MKNLLMSLTFGAAALALPVYAQDAPAPMAADPPQAQGDANSAVSFQTFYDQLSSSGSWIKTDQYGYVFQPTESDPNWRPYTYGQWVNTDAGMTWQTDEPFGWATYHYGRWTNLANTGWVWVPGYTWAPAWVSWRQDDQNVGWAPLPPDSDVGIDYANDGDYYDSGAFDVGFHIGGDCDLAYGIGPWWYNFCPIAYIGDRDCWRHFRDRRDNFAFIHHTRNITNINFRRDGVSRFGRVRANGPSVASLNARAHTPIRQASLASVGNRNEAGLRGNTLGVFAPHVNAATLRTAQPANVSRSLNNVAVNRGTDINRPVAMNSHESPAAATSTQVQAASASTSGFGNAKVATANTHFSRELSQPLSSMSVSHRTGNSAVIPRTDARVTRSLVTRTFSTEPRVSNESRFTGEQATRTRAESQFTGNNQPVTRTYSTEPRVTNQSAFTGGNVYHAQQPAFQTHTQAPAFHSYSAPAASSFRAPASFSHTSAPSYHSNYSHSFSAPASHVSAPSGGGFHGGGGGAAHAAASSGGGGGGGHGGGAGHR